MKALVYNGPGKFALEERPMPTIDAATDAIVKLSKTTICGTDLHILKGDVPSCVPGRVLGHEGVGVIDQIGTGVTAFKVGDRVLISCISSCGKCAYCRKLMYSHCTSGGWILGNTIDGTQAEYVRVPYADTSLYPVPAGADEERYPAESVWYPTALLPSQGVLGRPVDDGSAPAALDDRHLSVTMLFIFNGADDPMVDVLLHLFNVAPCVPSFSSRNSHIMEH